MNDQPRPKFCVDEEVMVMMKYFPDIPKVRIISVEHCQSRDFHINGNIEERILYTGYVYFYEGSLIGARECSLRKLPPEDRISWNDCAFKPKILEHVE